MSPGMAGCPNPFRQFRPPHPRAASSRAEPSGPRGLDGGAGGHQGDEAGGGNRERTPGHDGHHRHVLPERAHRHGSVWWNGGSGRLG